MSDVIENQSTEPRPLAVPSVRRRIPPVLMAVVLLAVAHSPILLVYGQQLARREHYQIFPIMWLVLAGLLWHRGGPIRLRWPSGMLLLFDVTLVVASSWLDSPLIGYAGFACGCLGVLVSAQDQVTGRSLWPLILLLVPTVRLPLNLDTQVIHRLQLATTTSASQILERLNVVHFRKGVVLQLPDRELFVDEACSGIHSLFTLLGLAIIIAVVFRRHWLLSLLLFASVVIWAYFLNVIRVAIVVLGAVWWGCDLASGWSHDVLGYVLVFLSLVCLLSTDRLLLMLTAPIFDPETGLSLAEDAASLARWFNAFFRPPWLAPRPLMEGGNRLLPPFRWRVGLVLGLVVVATAQAVPLWARTMRQLWWQLPWYAEASLSPAYGTWQRGAFATQERSSSSIWGQRTCRWDFARGQQAATVSLDYPFEGWHELTNCYEGSGWRVLKREVIRPDGASDWPVVVARMEDGLGRHGLLYFSLFAYDGREVQPPRSLATALSERWKRATRSERTVQTQAFTGSIVPLTDDDAQQVLRLHLDARRDLRAAVLAHDAAGGDHE